MFNWAQTFYVDPSAVKNARDVGITRVDLYFRAKPPNVGNRSGIVSPGVEVRIVPCKNGIPDIDNMDDNYIENDTNGFSFFGETAPARREWGEIQASINASIATSFLFDHPYFLKTNQEYALLVKFDGDEDYALWTGVAGDYLIGTTTSFAGPSNKNVGKLYQYISPLNPLADQTSPVNSSPGDLLNTSAYAINQDEKYFSGNWTPINDTDLKFKIYIARYYKSGDPITSDTALFNSNYVTKSNDRNHIIYVNATYDQASSSYVMTAQCDKLEYIHYDRKNSSFSNLFYGEAVFQLQPFYPGAGSRTGNPSANAVLTVNTSVGTLYSDRINANGAYVYSNGTTFSADGGFNKIYSNSSIDKVNDEYIVVYHSNSSGDVYNVRKVIEVVSNTQLIVDKPLTFTNSAAKFFKSPVGFINFTGPSFQDGKAVNLLTLYESNANLTNRFVNNAIESITIASGGSGYSNSDYVVVSGYEDVANKVLYGNVATANVITDGSGVITQVMVTQKGCGFVSTPTITVVNSTGGTSTGTSADLDVVVGATLKTEFTPNNYFSNCEFINIEAHRLKPEISINNPLGTVYQAKVRTLYYKVADPATHAGKAYYLRSDPSVTDTPVTIFKNHDLILPNTAILPSRSNEFVIANSTGGASGVSVIGRDYSNAVVLMFTTTSNNDFIAPYIDPKTIKTHFGKYIINNDYTNEHTNYGNAYSKHVATKVSFATERYAEDLLVYLTAYRPANTDLKVYARIHNSNDPEAFDDKDWTLMELVDGIGVYSSKDNPSDFIELTYNFSQYPNTDVTLAGTSTVYQGQDDVVGSGTSFSNSTVYSQFNSMYDVANSTDFIVLTDHNFANNDQVTYYNLSTGSAVSGLANSSTYYVIDSNTSGIRLSTTKGGANINITSTASQSPLHYLYRTAVVPDDLVKIYSPLFPDNYAIHVVNSVTNSTHFTINKTLGDLSANLVNSVKIVATTAVANSVGTQTVFQTDFANGDFIAVWSNSTSYEVRKIVTVTSDAAMTVDQAFTFSNATSKYAKVTTDDFVNNSVSVSGLRVDRLAFKNQAYNYMPNENVARYYNSSMVYFDTFDTFQLKIVLLSDNDQIVPKIDDVRAIGVSA